jgi:hypothetical protein
VSRGVVASLKLSALIFTPRATVKERSALTNTSATFARKESTLPKAVRKELPFVASENSV